MGCSSSKNKKQVSAQSMFYNTDPAYPRKTSVLIKKRSSRGLVCEAERVPIHLSEPCLCVSEDLSGAFSVWGTGIV